MSPRPPSRQAHEENWIRLMNEVQLRQAALVFGRFRAEGIEPVLIKGPAAALLYPEDVPRVSTDLDVVVAPAHCEKARRLLQEKDFPSVPIDLHCGLKGLDPTRWEEFFGRSREVSPNGCGIRVPAEEDHLRILCVHWLQDGGEKPSKLLDVRYAVENRSGDFDWELCLGSVPAHRRLWIVSVILLAVRYAGLDEKALPDELDGAELPGWLPAALERIWHRKHPYKPLNQCLGDPSMFARQLLYRFPPNAVMATVGVEGRFDTGSRAGYRLRYVFRRILPSLGYVFGSVLKNVHNRLGPGAGERREGGADEKL